MAKPRETAAKPHVSRPNRKRRKLGQREKRENVECAAEKRESLQPECNSPTAKQIAEAYQIMRVKRAHTLQSWSGRFYLQ